MRGISEVKKIAYRTSLENLMMIGWSKHRYSHGLLMHLQIINGKVWVHQDRTDFEIGNLLIEDGVLKSDIVLGFVEPILRDSFGFATA
jgi:hypothetical protein